MADEIGVRVRLKELRKFLTDAKRVEKGIKGIGDGGGRALDRGGTAIASFATKGAVAFAALSAAAPHATAALGATAATLAPLAGLAGAAGAGAVAGAQGLGVLKLATEDLTDAYGGNKQALERLTPEAAAFVGTLHELDPAIADIRRAAQTGLFAGLSDGLQSAKRNLNVVKTAVGDTSTVLGDLARDAGDLVGSSAFGDDLAKVGKTNTKVLDDLGHAGLDLADAARHVIVEAGPLTEWLARTARDGAGSVRSWAQAARETGRMGAFFASTRSTLVELGQIVGPVAQGIGNLFGAADPGTRQDLLDDLERLAEGFERATRGGLSGEEVSRAVSSAFRAAAPAIADAAGHAFATAAPRAVAAFARAWWDSDLAGKLFIAAVLAAKFGVFSRLGALAAAKFGTSFRTTIGKQPPAVPPVVPGIPGGGGRGPGRTPPPVRGGGGGFASLLALVGLSVAGAEGGESALEKAQSQLVPADEYRRQQRRLKTKLIDERDLTRGVDEITINLRSVLDGQVVDRNQARIKRDKDARR